MKYFIILLFIMFSACQDSTQVEASSDVSVRDQASSAVQSIANKQNKSSLKFYVFTNNFYNAKGMERPYIRLTSVAGESYIVPPLEYDTVETKYALIDGFKVKSGCIKVPERAFPLKVYICDSVSCTQSRYLADVVMPGHYGIVGVGGLFTPQVHPVSPCSDELVQYIKKDIE